MSEILIKPKKKRNRGPNKKPRPPISEETRAKMSASATKKFLENPMSLECRQKISNSKKGEVKSKETRHNMSEAQKKVDRTNRAKMSAEQRKYRSDLFKGRAPWNTGHKLSEAHKASISKAHKGKIKSPEHLRNNGLARRGANCHFWKGGMAAINTEDRARVMQTSEYRQWRKAILLRDNKTCIWKDETCSGNLHVDHIKPWRYFPNLRLDIDNGRVLCAHHHRQTDTYAGRLFYKYKDETVPEIGMSKNNV